jgi:hypothetical protein
MATGLPSGTNDGILLIERDPAEDAIVQRLTHSNGNGNMSDSHALDIPRNCGPLCDTKLLSPIMIGTLREIEKGIAMSSQRDALRSVVEACHGLLGDRESMSVMNRCLGGICSVNDWSESGLVEVLDHSRREAASEAVSTLVKLLWKGIRWVRPGLAVADRCYKALLMARGSVERFRAREGALVCFTGFEVLRIERPGGWAWPRQPAEDEVRVIFEMEGVCMRPLLRRTPRGIVGIPGTAVLLPFTMLRIGSVVRFGDDAEVSFSCVEGSYWSARRGSRLPCASVAVGVERLYQRGRRISECWGGSVAGGRR